MNYTDINSKTIDQWIEDGWEWGRPIDHETFECPEEHLPRCPHCGAEGKMEGKGTILTCHHCGKQYELTTLGELKALDGDTKISHIPDYYRWEREQVRQEILDGTYETGYKRYAGTLFVYDETIDEFLSTGTVTSVSNADFD